MPRRKRAVAAVCGLAAAAGVCAAHVFWPGRLPGRVAYLAEVVRWRDVSTYAVMSCTPDGRGRRSEAEFGHLAQMMAGERMAVSPSDRRVACVVVRDRPLFLLGQLGRDGYSTLDTPEGYTDLGDPAWGAVGGDLLVSAGLANGTERRILSTRVADPPSGPAGWRVLTRGGHHDSWPSPTRDGGTVFFIRDGSVAALNVESGAVRTLAHGGSGIGSYTRVEVSPGARRIAASLEGPSTGEAGIVLLDPGGATLRRVFEGRAGQFSWSPDGGYLAVSDRGSVVVVDLDGRPRSPIRPRAVWSCWGAEELSLPSWLE